MGWKAQAQGLGDGCQNMGVRVHLVWVSLGSVFWAQKAPEHWSYREPVPGSGKGRMEMISPFRGPWVWLNEMGVSPPIYRVGS